MTARKVFVITGTDTGVGKTWITAGLGRALVEMGIPTLALKPLETGCQLRPSLNEDGILMAHATGQTQPRAALARFSAPLAPPVAAEREDRDIDFQALMNQAEAFVEQNQVSLIEGAGGLLSPLTWDHTIIDIARHFKAQVIVVVNDKLGCLNHTRLTIGAIRAHELEIAAVVLTETIPEQSAGRLPLGHHTTAPGDLSADSNYNALSRLEDVPSVEWVPYTETMEETADALRDLARRLVE